ncbi:MAG: hypothetical protein M3036_17345 [Bifidobacteriales bacterium]|nr:hypothetical protein [Bifidobacteriales bacterium]
MWKIIVAFILLCLFAAYPVAGIVCLALLLLVAFLTSGTKHGKHAGRHEAGSHEKANPVSQDGEETNGGGRFPYRLEAPPEDHVETPDETSARFRRSYMAAHDCTPCNARPEGGLIAGIDDCRGVNVARRQDHQGLFARYGKGAWMWVVVTRGVIAKGGTAGLPTLEVWLDGESAGYLTYLQAKRHYYQVPADGGVTQAHIRQDNKTGRYHMRVELPAK